MAICARKNILAMAVNLIIEMVMIWYCSEQFKLVTAGNGREWMRAHATFYGEVHGTSTDMGKLFIFSVISKHSIYLTEIAMS